MRITIHNFTKYNARKDVKNPSWFRLSHGLFEDFDFYGFSPAELVVWIYLLCCASKKSSDTFTLSIQHAEKVGRVKERDLLSAIRKLEEIQCVRVDLTDTLRGCDEHVTDAGATDRQTDRTEQAPAGSPSPSWLAETWNQYSGSLSKVTNPNALSSDRERAARARLKEKPEPQIWVEVITRMAKNDFCLGKKNSEKHPTWRADFDWLIKPGTIDRFLEGKYDSRGAQAQKLSAFARQAQAKEGA